MVPGELRTVIPFFIANPLLGRICASNPAGISKNNPVGISFLSNYFSVISSSKWANKSIPADNAVWYLGKGLFDLLMILIFIIIVLRFYWPKISLGREQILRRLKIEDYPLNN